MKFRTKVILVILAWILFAVAMLASASAPVQRFVRVGWDVIEDTPTRYTVMDTIKDTKTGSCRAFYRIEYPRQPTYSGSSAIALAQYGPIDCSGQPIVILPIPVSPIK